VKGQGGRVQAALELEAATGLRAARRFSIMIGL